MSESKLFTPLKVGAVTVPNRVFMAPLTRLRSIEPGDIPTPLMAEYYRQEPDSMASIVLIGNLMSIGFVPFGLWLTLESLPESLREAITIAAQSDFIAKELPVPLMNKYFEYQTQLCHGYESAPDPQAWERENCFLKI